LLIIAVCAPGCPLGLVFRTQTPRPPTAIDVGNFLGIKYMSELKNLYCE